jgi:peptidoglycan/LPS O-acetylase OafA/YrhL
LLASGIVLTVSFSTRLRALFSTKLSRFFGRVSFPLYLIQVPVICSWTSYWYITLPALGFSNAAAIAINLSTTVIICLVLSVSLLPLDRFAISTSKRLGELLLRQTGSAPALPASKGLQRQNS